MREFLIIGSTPHGESCAQVGSDNYDSRARAECRLFMQQITKHYPEPENGYLKIKSNPHDFGTYYEVAAYYEDDDSIASEWAFDIESDKKNVLELWEVEFNPASK